MPKHKKKIELMSQKHRPYIGDYLILVMTLKYSEIIHILIFPEDGFELALSIATLLLHFSSTNKIPLRKTYSCKFSNVSNK